jgi:hypothetical protein
VTGFALVVVLMAAAAGIAGWLARDTSERVTLRVVGVAAAGVASGATLWILARASPDSDPTWPILAAAIGMAIALAVWIIAKYWTNRSRRQD